MTHSFCNRREMLCLPQEIESFMAESGIFKPGNLPTFAGRVSKTGVRDSITGQPLTWVPTVLGFALYLSTFMWLF
jgi:hypothetical protein